MDKQFLYDLGFRDPNFGEYKKNGFDVFLKGENWFMTQNGVQWMALNKKDSREIFHFYSHWFFAEGHCICTGLGFALRENWLLSKKEVSKITVIENNQNVIDYHNRFNPHIMSQLEVINADAFEYIGSCDTLLIDNFEGGITYEAEFCYHAKKITEKISCKKMWFWPIEFYLATHYRNYLGLGLEQIYNNIKSHFKLDTLPKLNEEELFKLCYIYYRGNFKKCDFTKTKHKNANS